MDMPITVPRASVAQSGDDLKARDMVLCRFPEVDMVVGKAGRAETPTDPAPLDMIETMVEVPPPRALAAPEARPARRRGARSSAVVGALVARRPDRAGRRRPSGWPTRPSTAADAALRRPDARVRLPAESGVFALARASTPAAWRSTASDARGPAPLARARPRRSTASCSTAAPRPVHPARDRGACSARPTRDPGLVAVRRRAGNGSRPSPSRRATTTAGAGRPRHVAHGRRCRRASRRSRARRVPGRADARRSPAGCCSGRSDREDLVGFGGELDRAVPMPGWTNVWTMPIQNRVDMLATGVNTTVGVRVLGRDLDDVVAGLRGGSPRC